MSEPDAIFMGLAVDPFDRFRTNIFIVINGIDKFGHQLRVALTKSRKFFADPVEYRFIRRIKL